MIRRYDSFLSVLFALTICLCGSFISIHTNRLYLSIALGLASIILLYRLLRIHKNTQKKVDFMFNAIACDDFSFNFPEHKGSIKERSLNALLNRIKEIIIDAKVNAVEREKYYEHIFNSIDTGILIINSDGKIFQSNEALSDMLGLKVITHINHISKVSPDLALQISSIHPNEPLQARIENEWGNTALTLSATHIMLKDKQMKLVAISNVDKALDKKEMESWSKLTRVLTHEIMNSLAPITSLSESLIEINKDPRLAQGLSTIHQTNKSLASFVDSYRNFTRIQQPVKSPFEIAPLIDNIISLLCPKDIVIKADVNPQDIMIYADENQILQVLVNLIKNASQAIEELPYKEINIKAYIKEDENVVIEIFNNGPAIDNSAVENLFIPFFTTKEGGKGVGLAISKQIMQHHNGQLLLSNNHEGEVCFTLLFR